MFPHAINILCKIIKTLKESKIDKLSNLEIDRYVFKIKYWKQFYCSEFE